MKCQNQNYHSQVHVSSKGQSLMVEKKQPISRETFEVVKKGQDLQQVVELKLEKKTELIVEDHRNQEIVIIENIVEDPLEVKGEDESITHNPQVPVDLLKTTTQYVDFLGIENFNFIINPFLIDVANKLKLDEKKFYATLYEGFKFQSLIKLLKHLKYLFIWSGRFQISKMNSRTSLFQMEGFDVGHNLLFNYCNLLFLVFLCKKKVILGLGELFPYF